MTEWLYYMTMNLKKERKSVWILFLSHDIPSLRDMSLMVEEHVSSEPHRSCRNRFLTDSAKLEAQGVMDSKRTVFGNGKM